MFHANGDFFDTNSIAKQSKQSNDIVENFSDCNCKKGPVVSNLFGVGDAPQISNEDIENAQKIMESEGKNLSKIKSLEIGSLFHKKIRSVMRPFLKPGLKLSELAEIIENTCKSLTKNKGINRGIGFPSSLSVNECAAHFSPSKMQDVTLDEKSITKIDFGVEVNGWITDCAFTVAFNDEYINLLKGVQEATNHGIKTVAIDQDIGEWGAGIKEIMNSYEVTIDGKTYPIQPIKNLGGHNILKNKIHGGIFLPSSNVYEYVPYNRPRFVENVYAVETFGSTKSNTIIPHSQENTVYMRKFCDKPKEEIREKLDGNYVKIFDIIDSTFKTMAFSDRYLETYKVFEKLKPMGFDLSKQSGLDKFKKNAMSHFTSKNIYTAFPPLYCLKDGMTAQYEHTIYLSENKKIIFSNSTDY